MIKYLSVILLFSLCLLAVRCTTQSGNDEKLSVIDIVGSLGTFRQVQISEIVEAVEYIPLETPDGVLVGDIPCVKVIDDRIFISSSDRCFAFTRDGKFLHKIGNVGRGPGEYTLIRGFSVNETSKRIYLDPSQQDLLEYTWDGVFVREISKPILGSNDYYGTISPREVSYLSDGLFMGHIHKTTGQEPYNWIIFNDEGTIVKTYDNHIKVEKGDFVGSIMGAAYPIVAESEVYVKEHLNDTLFVLDRGLELVPKAVFGLGKYTYPTDVYLDAGGEVERDKNLVLVNMNMNFPMQVTPRNIFFHVTVGENLWSTFGLPNGNVRSGTLWGQAYRYYDTRDVVGIYDAANERTELLDRDSVTRKLGLVNDIDGGLSFWPQYYNEAEKKLVQVVGAYEMKELLTEEHFAAHPAKDPVAHARLRELLKNLDETDNPVIVIAKLKD